MDRIDVRRCPRCRSEVHDTPDRRSRAPHVVQCPVCGAEVPFSPERGVAGGRTAFSDPSTPEPVGGLPGGPLLPCPVCGADIPLHGVSHVERTGALPDDMSDTVTCPACHTLVDIDPAAIRRPTA